MGKSAAVVYGTAASAFHRLAAFRQPDTTESAPQRACRELLQINVQASVIAQADAFPDTVEPLLLGLIGYVKSAGKMDGLEPVYLTLLHAAKVKKLSCVGNAVDVWFSQGNVAPYNDGGDGTEFFYDGMNQEFYDAAKKQYCYVVTPDGLNAFKGGGGLDQFVSDPNLDLGAKIAESSASMANPFTSLAKAPDGLLPKLRYRAATGAEAMKKGGTLIKLAALVCPVANAITLGKLTLLCTGLKVEDGVLTGIDIIKELQQDPDPPYVDPPLDPVPIDMPPDVITADTVGTNDPETATVTQVAGGVVVVEMPPEVFIAGEGGAGGDPFEQQRQVLMEE